MIRSQKSSSVLRATGALCALFVGFAQVAIGFQNDELVPISPREEQGRRDVQIGFRSLVQDETLEQEEELPAPKSTNETSLRDFRESDPLSDPRFPSLVGEAVRQRYPDGKVQILRYVRQDETGNFYNDGPWKLFNREGQVMAEGQFKNGLMHGTWTRWHPANAEGLFRSAPLSTHTGPFLSVTSFNIGKLDGVWTIYDRSRRKIFEMQYVDGLRDGSASWWSNTGALVRETHFQQGLMHGDAIEFDSELRPAKQTKYIHGRRVYSEVTMHREKEKKSEDFFLDAKLELNGEDNWWDAIPAEYVSQGTPIRHGPTRAWHDNGQQRLEGQYEDNSRQGKFTWWYANGQQQLTGQFHNDQKTGQWTWWHENGMKAVQGQFEANVPMGQWSWWDDDGKIIRSGEIGAHQIDADPIEDDDMPNLNPPAMEGFEEIAPADGESDKK